MLPLPPEISSLSQTLAEQWSRSTAYTHPAPAPERSNDVEPLEDVSTFLRGLESERARLREIAAYTLQGCKTIAEADHYLPHDTRAVIGRIEQGCREWSDRYANLEFSENHPLATFLRRWIRPYNDDVKSLRRTLIDAADLLARRLAEEEAEDAAGETWLGANPPLTGEEEVEAWDDVKSKLASGA